MACRTHLTNRIGPSRGWPGRLCLITYRQHLSFWAKIGVLGQTAWNKIQSLPQTDPSERARAKFQDDIMAIYNGPSPPEWEKVR